MKNVEKFVERLDKHFKMNPTNKFHKIIDRLPLVSAIYPQKYVLAHIPILTEPASSPFCSTVQFISHCDNGRVKLTTDPSIYPLIIMHPEINMRSMLNHPNSGRNEN